MTGRIVAFDIGDKRVGVAVSDPFNTFALPAETYWRTKDADADAANLVRIAEEKGAGRIVCGLPLNFDGSESVQTEKTRRFAERLRQKTQIEIVFEDEWLIVVDKRSGVLSMSTGAEGEVTAYSLISDYLKRMHGRNSKVFIVHRLDRETSGLIIFAKDERTKQKLQENWREEVLMRG